MESLIEQFQLFVRFNVSANCMSRKYEIEPSLATLSTVDNENNSHCYYRWPRDELVQVTNALHIHGNAEITTVAAKWQSMISSSDQSWKEAARKMMDIYVQRKFKAIT